MAGSAHPARPARLARTRRAATAGTAAAALALAAGCAGSAGAGDAARPAGSAKAVTVDVDTFSFSPDPLRVPAGTTVTWVNHDAIRHTVTSGERTYYGPGPMQGLTKEISRSGLFDEQLEGRDATASYTFVTPGTYHYLCTRHPGMDAEVVVG